MIKYGILGKTLCRSKAGYISNFEIYTSKGKLQETILYVLEPYLNSLHYICQDNY